jgi:hypothetical protein
MKGLLAVFRGLHALLSLLFAAAAVSLIVVGTRKAWHAFSGDVDTAIAQAVIEAMGVLAAAVVALQISETIMEEEVIRHADISAPTRVRRFLSRFFVVIVVSLAIEGLVATFKAIHEDLTHLAYASSVVAATAALLIAWGVFVHLNRSAEELEPEAMEDAKREDRKLKPGGRK